MNWRTGVERKNAFVLYFVGEYVHIGQLDCP